MPQYSIADNRSTAPTHPIHWQTPCRAINQMQMLPSLSAIPVAIHY